MPYHAEVSVGPRKQVVELYSTFEINQILAAQALEAYSGDDSNGHIKCFFKGNGF